VRKFRWTSRWLICGPNREEPGVPTGWTERASHYNCGLRCHGELLPQNFMFDNITRLRECFSRFCYDHSEICWAVPHHSIKTPQSKMWEQVKLMVATIIRRTWLIGEITARINYPQNLAHHRTNHGERWWKCSNSGSEVEMKLSVLCLGLADA
jgi:hypothetical protein